ncbi:MAG: hypothetical protein B6D44_17670 [Ignavibacteriales bacterium UTCHB2]|jgi:hypothetical protein|nr:MAG: hypothetical protein B6D44_17670 [Ignavibacteriales bacterium UTCHB2]
MTQSQIRYIENHLQFPNRMIAQKLDMTEAQIRNYLHRQSIKRTPEQLEQIRLRLASNMRNENNGNYKGGISKNNYHYKKIQVKRYPERVRARQKKYYHVRQGNISPQPCEVCGTTKSIEAHHEDYSQPLDIVWLCTPHHRELHQKEREQVGIISGTVSS